eukprot:3639044-Pleurochrysis_carterae.AAC.1
MKTCVKDARSPPARHSAAERRARRCLRLPCRRTRPHSCPCHQRHVHPHPHPRPRPRVLHHRRVPRATAACSARAAAASSACPPPQAAAAAADASRAAAPSLHRASRSAQAPLTGRTLQVASRSQFGSDDAACQPRRPGTPRRRRPPKRRASPRAGAVEEESAQRGLLTHRHEAKRHLLERPRCLGELASGKLVRAPLKLVIRLRAEYCVPLVRLCWRAVRQSRLEIARFQMDAPHVPFLMFNGDTHDAAR